MYVAIHLVIVVTIFSCIVDYYIIDFSGYVCGYVAEYVRAV